MTTEKECAGNYELITVKAGDGKSYPVKGEGVVIHYTAKLATDGTVVDSSVGQEPLRVNIGCGEVIKAWDLAIPRMSVGEVATLNTGSELAYGEQGAGELIPPNADLTFEVELLSLAPAANKKQNDAVVVDRSSVIEFEARQKKAAQDAIVARQKAREVEIDAMRDMEELKAALKESELLKETVRRLEEEKASIEEEKVKEHERANAAVLERIRVREELGMSMMQVSIKQKELTELQALVTDYEARIEAAKPKIEVCQTHTWTEAGSLGLKLSMRPRDKKEKSGLKVNDVTGEGVPIVLKGLKFYEVNGECIDECTYEECLATIKAAGRPLTATFCQP